MNMTRSAKMVPAILSLTALSMATPAHASDWSEAAYLFWGGLLIVGAVLALIIWAIIDSLKS